MQLFGDPLHDEFGTWALGFVPYGGADVGELVTLAGDVKRGDDDSFYEAFAKLASRRIAAGDEAAAAGHRESAYECYLRGALLLMLGLHPLYGMPVDPRLVDAFHRAMTAFDEAMTLGPYRAEQLRIPYQGTQLPAYFVRAPGRESEVRPVVLVGGGWDSTVIENYLGMGVAALRRGYHVLLHDGPGQGRLLIDQGLPLRHDWEKVVTPVVDAALGIDVVDRDGIVYQPWSLGGYFAPRVAAFEHRLAAIVADPGQLDVGVKFTQALPKMGLSADAVAKLPQLDPADEQKLMSVIRADRSLWWKIVQRGFWTNGAHDLSSFIAEIQKWRLDSKTVGAITCPTLVMAAESDLASSNARELYDALQCPKRFVEFTHADGAGMHCELLNRSLANRVVLDWLDDVLARRQARTERGRSGAH